MARVTDQKLVVWIVAIVIVLVMLGGATYLYSLRDGPPTFATTYRTGQPGG